MPFVKIQGYPGEPKLNWKKIAELAYNAEMVKNGR